VSDSEDYHVDLSPGLTGGDELSRLLTQLVEAAGGQAGVMTTRIGEECHLLTSLYGIDSEESSHLVKMMEEMVEQSEAVSPDALAALEKEARCKGSGKPLAVPVRSGGKSVGVICLWHPGEAPPLLQESPGLVHLNLDKLELGLQGARLLERLLHERKWLEAVVQHSSDGVVIHDPKGRVMGYNLAAAKLSGWKLGEAVGELSHESFPLVLLEHTSHVFDAQNLAVPGSVPWLASTDPVEARLLTRAGQSVEVEVVGAPLFDRQGQSLGWVMTMRDITRRKEMDRLQKLFLSAVSHELQTPIAIIRGYAGLMADPEVSTKPEQVQKQAQVIVEEAQRLEGMVTQMLYATRLQAGGVKLQREPVELGPWLKKIIDKLKPVIHKLSFQDAKETLVSPIDAEKLQQVVTNLVENARKYGGPGPIKVVLRAEAGKIRVDVLDCGPGIPTDERERIFTPFERGGDPLKQRVRGAGLGLYICKAIVEAHGGKVGVEANPEGGAIFYFSLSRER
jgi:PAS domain S-box-containing protein